MAIYDKASLVLIPSGTKTSKVYSQKPTNGDGDFTFSRSTAATRVNASGNIEKETENLLTRSNEFNTWSFTSGSSVTANQSGYDGSNNAWLLTDSGATGSYGMYRNFNDVGVLTASIYAKAASTNEIELDFYGNVYPYVKVDLTTGTITGTASHIDAQSVDVGNGWWRISVTGNLSSTSYVRIGCDGAGSIYIQDAQVEYGLVARDYIETTTTAIYGGITDNVPRLDYTDSSCPALLLEPQRFNAIDSSEYGGAWAAINANITKTENATTSPEGVNNAVKLEGLTTSSANQIVNFGTTSLNGVNVVGKTYTASLYLKPVNAGDVGKDIVLSIQRNTGDFEGFNVTTEITSADWKRYDLTYTFTGAGAGDQVGATFKILSPVSTTIDDIYIWGVQLEEGSYATSYIPTYGSAVTRNADYMTTISLDTKSIIPDNESWSAFFEVELLGNESPNDKIQLSDNSNDPRAFLYANTAGVAGTGWSGTEALAMNTNNKIMYRGNSSTNITFFENGVNAETFSNTGNPLTFNRVNFYGNNGAFRLKRAILFPTALTDQEAIDLTTL